MEFTKDGRSYEERTRCPLMDGIGYVTELLNSQERESSKQYMNPSNKFFNKLYHKKLPKTAEEEYRWSKKRASRYNKILNETVKNSSPQFYVEQSFKTDSVENDKGKYYFKLDPGFMSCNSGYKTIGLRGIFMKPKRYTLRYGCNLKITTPTVIDQLVLANAPTFKYTHIDYQQYNGKNRIKSMTAIIQDSEQNIYDVEYLQDYKTGKPVILNVIINGRYQGVVINTNTVTNIDIGNNKTVDFDFYPDGEVVISTNYTESGTKCSIEETFTKSKPYDSVDTTCINCEKTKYTLAETIDKANNGVTANFSLTLLPENSIEVFAYEVCRQVNEKLKDHTNAHVNACEISFDYESNTNTLVFHFGSSEDGVRVEGRFIPIDSKHLSDCITFNNILNQTDYPTDPKYGSDIVFKNVWNREYFFVHASYMNLPQYNQLDRTGNLYPKPTKLIKYTSSNPDIYFWTSINGVDKFILVDQDFEVDAALIANLNNVEFTL